MLISISSDSMLDSCSEAHWLGAAADALVGGRTISNCTDHQRTSATGRHLTTEGAEDTETSQRRERRGKQKSAVLGLVLCDPSMISVPSVVNLWEVGGGYERRIRADRRGERGGRGT
jgi:hypothetical protein